MAERLIDVEYSGGGIENERVLINSFVSSSRGRNLTSEERMRFLNWMFDHIAEMRSHSRNELAHLFVRKYASETGLRISKDWLYYLIRLGIYRDNNGLGLSEPCEYTIEQLCEKPSLIKTKKN